LYCFSFKVVTGTVTSQSNEKTHRSQFSLLSLKYLYKI